MSNTYSTEEYTFKTYSDKEMEENYDKYNYFDRWYYDDETVKFLKDKELEKILSEPYGYYDYDEEKYCY